MLDATRQEVALQKAKAELSLAIHISECGKNAGIRAINSEKAEWLATIVYWAEKALAERRAT